jgi:hypothetical protein
VHAVEYWIYLGPGGCGWVWNVRAVVQIPVGTGLEGWQDLE